MRRIVEKLWILFVARVLMSSGFSLSFPYLALYLNKQRGVPLPWVGSLLAANILAAAIAQAAGGAVSDRLGRRPVMLFGLISRCLAVFAIYRAVDVSAHFLWIAALHFTSSTLGAVFDPAASAWAADRLPHHERARAYSLLRTGGNIGWAIGPAIGGFAAGHAYALLFFWTAVAYAAVSVLVFYAVADPLPSSARSAGGEGGRRPDEGSGDVWRVRFSDELSSLRDPKLRRLCLGTALLGVAMAQLIAPFSLYAVRFDGLVEREVGFLFSLNGGMVALFQVGVVYLLRRHRLTTQLIAGALLYGLGFCAVGFARGFWAMAGAMVVITLGEMAGAPAEQALAANLAPEGRRGRYIGAVGLAAQAGWAVGPLAAGWLLERWGPLRPSPYWLGVGLLSAAAAAGFITLRGIVGAREEGVEFEQPVALQPVM